MRKSVLFFYLIPATIVAIRVAVVFEVQFAQPSHTPEVVSAAGTHTVSASQRIWQIREPGTL
ncbi:hypothetical protein RA28_20560 [Ruegeria sp. ANG-S4]|nr:hypothetical protein RA28_20560 [Ruegeria sp. ANG-S4]